MSEQQPNVIVRGPRELSDAEKKAGQVAGEAIARFLEEHNKPEDHKLNEGERKALAEFVASKNRIAKMTDADEAHEEETILAREVLEWKNGGDVTFHSAALDVDEHGVSGKTYDLALIERRRGEAAMNAGLL